MISTPDRQQAVALSKETHRAGARWSRATGPAAATVPTPPLCQDSCRLTVSLSFEEGEGENR